MEEQKRRPNKQKKDDMNKIPANKGALPPKGWSGGTKATPEQAKE
ncbi:hypothetical protein JOD43_003140 [Pullulanibacillus pueri]|uniref:Uncharacterized protein n=1 Tax=Pullulanibacillus pueri TaxID=1437324 RepID=A0A8J2ZXR0_9BACL|nr:hypothetical protein [Pullulanibacillus pueri]GGH84670.1 hypothetical protein GCM10007096_28280 [Pullulanibacillus pueri]